MDLNGIPQRLKLAAEVATLTINAALALAFYGAELNIHDAAFVKNNLTGLSEGGFCLGAIVVLAALLTGRKLLNPYYRWLVLSAGTMFNQACLLGLLASAIPFKLG